MDIDDTINQALEDFQVPGCAVGIVAQKEVAFIKGYGLRNLAKRLPVTQETLFPIGSCTTPFTTFTIGQLVDQGFLEWDDPVIEYIPEFCLQDPYATEHMTLRDLAAHRSGLPRHDPVWVNSDLSPKDLISRLQYLELSCCLREKFQYNNMMFSLLGLVIERALGTPWEEVVRAQIMTPLHMHHSNFSIEELQDSGNFSLPYVESNGEVHSIAFRRLAHIGATKSINSSVHDLVKWLLLQVSDGSVGDIHFIEKQTLRELQSLQITAFNIAPSTIHSLGSGLGWNIGLYKDHYVVHRNGLLDGFMSMTVLLPEKKTGVVVLSNSSSPGFHFVCSILHTILDQLLNVEKEDWLSIEKAKYEQNKVAAHEKTESQKTTPILALKEYKGSYVHPGYGTVRIDLENGHLSAFYNRMAIPLMHKEKETFIGRSKEKAYPYMKWDFIFLNNSYNAVSELHISFEPAVKPIIFKRTIEK